MVIKEKIIILGAGIGGLSVGYFLAKTGKYEVTVLEKLGVTGGLCGSFIHRDFTLDYGAHKIYSVIPGVLETIRDLMEDRLLELQKKNRLYLRGHLVDYPLKIGNLASVLGVGMFLKLGFGYGFEFLRGMLVKNRTISYEDYMIRRFGRPAYELVFEPLADKVWGDPASLHAEMARARVPASGGLDVILKLLGLKKETKVTNAELFYYPRHGFGDFPASLKRGIEDMGGRVITNVDVREIVREGSKITAVRALINEQLHEFSVDYLISSIPLMELGRLIFPTGPEGALEAIDDLQFRHLILIYIFIKRSLVLKDQWIFFPEREFIFSRIFEQKQMNPDLGPEAETVLCCDFTCADDSREWNAADDSLVEKAVDGLVAGKFIRRDEVNGSLVKRVRNFYPRYDLAYVEKIKQMNAHLQQDDNLLLTGRIGMYNYNNSDHCLDMGRFIAENLARDQAPRNIWKDLEKRVANYRIVD